VPSAPGSPSSARLAGVPEGILLRAERGQGGTQAELEVLQEMSREGVRPDVDTFNILMGGRLRSGDYAAVARLFRQLLGMGYCPDSISYTSLIAALARLGRFQDAVRLPSDAVGLAVRIQSDAVRVHHVCSQML
jgi:pentatricopeptide repeat protein